MFPAECEKDDQPDNQPDKKPHPVRYPELSHQVKVDQQTDHRDQGHLFPDAYSGEDNCSKDKQDDWKFGFEVMVWLYADDTAKIVYKKVYVSKNTWERLPSPSDTVIVNIEYVENIEYGKTDYGRSIIWDVRFNMCTGYTVEIKK